MEGVIRKIRPVLAFEIQILERPQSFDLISRCGRSTIISSEEYCYSISHSLSLTLSFCSKIWRQQQPKRTLVANPAAGLFKNREGACRQTVHCALDISAEPSLTVMLLSTNFPEVGWWSIHMFEKRHVSWCY